MRANFGWEKRQVWFIPLADERGVCRSNCEILEALENACHT